MAPIASIAFAIFLSLATLQIAQADEGAMTGEIEGLALDQRITNVSSSLIASRMDELERRLGDLERMNRAQDERIRQLDRTLDDLKRRR